MICAHPECTGRHYHGPRSTWCPRSIERKRESYRKFIESHPDYKREYYKKQRAAIGCSVRPYRRRPPNYNNAQACRDWYWSNPEKSRARNRKWRAENPIKVFKGNLKASIKRKVKRLSQLEVLCNN